MPSGDAPSEDSEQDNNETTKPREKEQSDTDQHFPSSDEDTDEENPEGSDDSTDRSGYNPFGRISQELAKTVKAAHLPLARQLETEQFRKAVQSSLPLSTMTVLNDPEIQKQLSKPLIDPDEIANIQKATLAISNAVDLQGYPDKKTVETLQKLDDPAVVEAYETAASLKQIEQPSTKEQENEADTAPAPGDDQGIQEQDKPETELAAEPLEDPVQGSAFLQYTATNLLSYSEQLPEDATKYLEKIRDTEEAEKQKEYFSKAVPELGEKGIECLKLLAWQWVGMIITFYYGSDAVDLYQDEDVSVEKAEDGENQ
ncbi:hypothetical protein [Natrinema gelatinilyticum]|uniref:hypothetical protein n=1 Tax=Natrinema gelatinilyticum TaxID=2961571 RepID=UPI0020C51A9E|nr:hypothetical protein [Natrinema gelatinilyticum]